ncbi:hypothetical protein [Aurantiacibacter sp. D1-12]|uniref:hypothetical protein n=1 Tax=Aurantiacibacter sp. D1-12 TaxID=2993658 RepID=UPI00237D0E04|nr:hypothetical protein [Aurantiacibacter sp. D1-12]MDE1468388.1 hypothetical protein [Aurantiacibacter sp. D1-12]
MTATVKTNRERLQNWLSHVGVLLLFWWLSMTAFWLFGRVNPEIARHQAYPSDVYWFMADPLTLYILWLPIILIWHGTNPPKTGKLSSLLLSFRPFLAISTIGMAAHSVASSGILTGERCPDVPRGFDGETSFGFINCSYGPPSWLSLLVVGPLIFASFMTLSKTIIAILILNRQRK